MSHIRIKTTYQESDGRGLAIAKTIYADHNLSCDVITIYDSEGDVIFSFEDTEPNNLFDAIKRLVFPFKENRELADGVDYCNEIP